MTGPLAHRVVVVTGAARGIGAALAAGCHAAGATVVAVDRHWSPTADVAWRTENLDVTDGPAVAALVRDLGTVDCLVNNAGINRRAALPEQTDELWREVHEVNLAAPVRLIRAFLPVLRAPGGSVVNVSSIRARRGFADDSAYIAAKGGLDAATRALAVELGPAGIRVNAVAPGAIETDLNRDILADPAHRDRVLRRIPLGRLGRPDDIAAAVVYLAGDGAAFVTGTVLTIDGGQTALG